ncbi:ribonuclease H-like domain-containing protein [Amanita rubescens]|nr:ribonuclease H-like domain-containing protein [Amanita rubescens]
MSDTDVVLSLKDVYNDFDMIRKQLNIKSWKAKFVKRKYAFGEKKVPRGESQWLKVVWVHCPSIEQMFGTNKTTFKSFVLKRKIIGPCWLQVKHPKIENQGISWCKVDVVISNPKNINPFSETDPDAPKDLPPLTVLNLSVRTIVNHKENRREIGITSRIWHNMNIHDPTPPDKLPCTVQTFVRPLLQFPPNFEARAKADGKGTISPAKNERMLLNTLLSAVTPSSTIHNLNKSKISIFKVDPDVIIGHEFLNLSLDVLLHRMRELKTDHWSRLGRFRRSKWPSIGT